MSGRDRGWNARPCALERERTESVADVDPPPAKGAGQVVFAAASASTLIDDLDILAEATDARSVAARILALECRRQEIEETIERLRSARRLMLS